jgi:tricorn protease
MYLDPAEEFRQIFYCFAQQDRKGAILDERFNGGGSAADYIIEVLQRDFDGYFTNAAGDRYPFTSPAAGIWGPKVMIINEMAGSGGDLMPYMFKRRKIGPRAGFFTHDLKWAVENEGVGPDIEVENFPKDVIAGRDPQLERAVEEALRLLKANPLDRATKEPTPPTWGVRKK